MTFTSGLPNHSCKRENPFWSFFRYNVIRRNVNKTVRPQTYFRQMVLMIALKQFYDVVEFRFMHKRFA